MQIRSDDFLDSLPVLVKHEVRFIVVGGVCAVLHGAPVTTFDLDIVHSRSSENLHRLVLALTELEAYYRGHPGKRLKPDAQSMSSSGHHLLMTKSGPLDVLGTIGNQHDYEELLAHTEIISTGEMQLRILTLEHLIRIKEESSHEKDRFVLSILKSILKEKNRL
ncbi:MAG: hypothetical protein R2941_07955 [Desulfobacterales bacterium]